MEDKKNWGSSAEKLSKNFQFKNFVEAMDFVNKVAKVAEKQNHHPEIKVNYNKVNVSIT
ncbi:4a-hydroxytetrahydrobiopterin dehydratase, partial [bacterium]|nr:4a-hydroxytetrahydrobiopterin dehydratase [bacterium]